MIENVEQSLCDFDLSICIGWTIFPHINLKFSQQKQNSFNKEEIFPSFETDTAVSHFSHQTVYNLFVTVLTYKSSLDQCI